MSMTKNNNTRAALLLLILWNVGLSIGYSQSSGVKDDGNQITINPGQFHVVFEKGTGYSDNYVLFGESSHPYTYFDNILFLMPLAKAEELASQYGDFSQCINAGANMAKQSTKDFIVIAANAQVKKEIDKIGEIINSSISAGKPRHPIVKINMVELKILKLVMIINGQEVSVEQNRGEGMHSLVKDIEIINEDYRMIGNR